MNHRGETRKKPKINHLSYEAREKLFNSCLNFAYHKADKFRFMEYHHYLDMRQAALEGLWFAAMTFNPMLGNKFITHAKWRIWSALSQAYYYKKQEAREAVVDMNCSVDSEDKLSYLIESSTSSCDNLLTDDREDIQRYLSVLKPRHRQMIEMRYLKGMKLQTIAAHFKITRQNLEQHISRALREIRLRFRIELGQPHEG